MALDRLRAAAVDALDDYYARCRAAEENIAQETHAATVLQCAWRGLLQRLELKRLSHIALTIQRYWRGYLGRKRFAAFRAIKDEQLRQAYFNHQATVIQKCWRGYYSRSHIHDFYKRKAYLKAVAAANAEVRAAMQAELQEALVHQQQTAERMAKQCFDLQVSRLHHLTSTRCTPGIFSPPAAADTPVIAGIPLEQHLRVAGQLQAEALVKRQRTVIKQTLGKQKRMQQEFLFPAGSLASRQASTLQASAGCTAAKPAGRQGIELPAIGGHRASNTVCTVKACSNSCRTTKGSQTLKKLATAVVDAVDEEYNAKAEPNMVDGSFNPALTLQQTADYEAERQAAELDRRISRGMMLTLHNGQPFVNSSKPPSQESHTSCNGGLQSSPGAVAACTPAWSTEDVGSLGVQKDVSNHEKMFSAGSPQQWKHNRFPGSFFSKHLKQAY